MSREKRVELISNIESILDCKILCYLTSTRSNFSYSIHDECLPRIYNHLKELSKITDGKQDKVGLFISSYGGDADVPNLLIRLLRKYYNTIYALIPSYARSAATLIALGANKIFMHPMGSLGPIDLLIANEFSPVDQYGYAINISIEDLLAYKRFLVEEWNLSEPEYLSESLNTLTDEIHPITIGALKRAIDQSKEAAKALLLLHMKNDDGNNIDEIVEGLTSKTYSHGQPISQIEAHKIGLNIERINEDLEEAIWELYSEYVEEMKLNEPFDPISELNNSGEKELALHAKMAFIESEIRTDVYTLDYKIERPQTDRSMDSMTKESMRYSAIVIPLKSGWVHYKDESEMMPEKKKKGFFGKNK